MPSWLRHRRSSHLMTDSSSRTGVVEKTESKSPKATNQTKTRCESRETGRETGRHYASLQTPTNQSSQTTTPAPSMVNTHHNYQIETSNNFFPRPPAPHRHTPIYLASGWKPESKFSSDDGSDSESDSDCGVSIKPRLRRKRISNTKRHIRTWFAHCHSSLSRLLRGSKGECSEKSKHNHTSSLLPPHYPPNNDLKMVKPAGNNTRAKSSSKDFVTGHCMTCDRLVKWPRGLSTFRCNICATVNDLKPLPGLRSSTTSDALQPTGGQLPGEQLISVHYTKQLVRRCIRDHLKSHLITLPPCLSRIDQDDQNHNGENLSPMASRHPRRASLGQSHPRGQGRRLDYQPRYSFSAEPTLRPGLSRSSTSTFQYSRCESSMPRGNDSDSIFKPLEDYLDLCFRSPQSINSAFFSRHPRHPIKTQGQGSHQRNAGPHASQTTPRHSRQSSGHTHPTITTDTTPNLDSLDHKLLLLGDVAENGAWWLGSPGSLSPTQDATPPFEDSPLCAGSPHINWLALDQWYLMIVNAAESWKAEYEAICTEFRTKSKTDAELQTIERELLRGQAHLRRVLMKRTDSLLKRPGGQLSSPDDMRFLLILMENPLLHPETTTFQGYMQSEDGRVNSQSDSPHQDPSTSTPGLASGHHSGLVKRIVGLLANTDEKVHRHLVAWFSTYKPWRFQRLKDLVFGFLSYRLLRQGERQETGSFDITAGLIPQMYDNATAASLHAELFSTTRAKEPTKNRSYSEDWQVRAAARFLALLFTTNSSPRPVRDQAGARRQSSTCDMALGPHNVIPSTDFYNSLIDLADLIGDFEAWEGQKGRFAFCQYPFLLSIWAKTKILEYDAQRQMKSKARDAFFDSIMTRRTVSQHLTLNVRRECLVDDSLKAVGEVIGSGSGDVKKGIKITFTGEEGIDAGGLRKEWFLLLIREVFSPDHGMFNYDEDSQRCYFNPHSFETSDQFFLVGVVIGLAIYNSTILDIALPPFAFRKLLAAAPAACLGNSPYSRRSMKYSLHDLAEYKPQLAKGLQQLLEYKGDDVESIFCLDFTVEVEKYGARIQVPLCEGGEARSVTNANRREYVDLVVRYWLDLSVSRQFEPFKRGFYTVCGGNAFSLFRAEEIELLIKGSDEALDIGSLRGSAEYDNWGTPNPDGVEPVIGWFWEVFQEALPQRQRQLLSFITGSDRLPATRASTTPIRIACLGDHSGRFPAARTCFNYLSLYRYKSKEQLAQFLWTAVDESEGFGLK